MSKISNYSEIDIKTVNLKVCILFSTYFGETTPLVCVRLSISPFGLSVRRAVWQLSVCLD